MALTEKDVRYVAELAHLELTDEEVTRFQPQLDSILQYVEKLNQLDTTEIEPMAQVNVLGKDQVKSAALRADVPRPCFTAEEALSNAPPPRDHLFKVPRVIERD